MWDVYSKNFWLRGVGYLDADPNIVKKYSKAEVPELGPLTYKELVERCDKFLVSHNKLRERRKLTLYRQFSLDIQARKYISRILGRDLHEFQSRC